MEERDGDDVLQASYINGAGLDEYLLMNRNSTNYWYMDSAIVGNMAALVNSSGSIQEGYTYRGYGQATVHTGAGNDGNWFTSDDATATSSAIGNPYLFTGRQCDFETGAYYYRARYYAVSNGDFFSRDPAGSEEGGNLYIYVRCSPATHADPLGLRVVTITIYYNYDDPIMVDDHGVVEQRIRDDVNRIFQDFMGRYCKKNADGSPAHTLVINWVPTTATSWQNAQGQGLPIGSQGGGFFHNNPTGVGIYTNDDLAYGQRVAGATGGWGFPIRPDAISNPQRQLDKQNDLEQGAATVAAHEIGNEILGGLPPLFHFHDTGYVDSKTGRVGGVFSNELCRLLSDNLDVE